MNNACKPDPAGLYSCQSFIFRRQPPRMLFGSSGSLRIQVFSSGQLLRVAKVFHRTQNGEKTNAAWKSFSCLGSRSLCAQFHPKSNDSATCWTFLTIQKCFVAAPSLMNACYQETRDSWAAWIMTEWLFILHWFALLFSFGLFDISCDFFASSLKKLRNLRVSVTPLQTFETECLLAKFLHKSFVKVAS